MPNDISSLKHFNSNRKKPIQNASYTTKMPTVNPLKASKNKHIPHAIKEPT
jgi:hypothetical protein